MSLSFFFFFFLGQNHCACATNRQRIEALWCPAHCKPASRPVPRVCFLTGSHFVVMIQRNPTASQPQGDDALSFFFGAGGGGGESQPMMTLCRSLSHNGVAARGGCGSVRSGEAETAGRGWQIENMYIGRRNMFLISFGVSPQAFSVDRPPSVGLAPQCASVAIVLAPN